LKLWERIVRISGDPIIGFRMALVAEFKSFGLLGHIAPRCATIRDAFEKTARYVAIASQATRLSIECDAKSMVITAVLEVPSGAVRQNILLQKVLQEVSDEHLARGSLTQSELAFLLGYSEQSAFSRAYKAWTGHPPGALTRVS
jgi:AraC-like DNA-binding protein